jgi:UTP--glucose-1-phosphate uridylyltransferase
LKIKKAIIPAAGLGTRFLPATKAQPKEMLPIVDKPTIQYIVEEAVASGIEDIIIISGRNKRAIEDHFDKSYELEEHLFNKGDFDILQELQQISNLANIHYIRQKEPKGLGHAISCASSFIGNGPFAVLLGDDIVDAEKPALKQLIEIYDEYKCSVVGVQPVADKDVSKYGIVNPAENHASEKTFFVEGLIEKPSLEDAASNYAVLGRYILTPEIFSILNELPLGAGGEIQLTDAIQQLTLTQKVIAHHFEGKRHDIGDKLGFIQASVDFALRRSDLRSNLLNYLATLVEREKSFLKS